jgi:hypothetical protein
MKRLIPLAGLCVLAIIAAPTASASAETLEGACAVTGGKAHFFTSSTEATPAFLNETPQNLGYNFIGETPQGICVEAPVGRLKDVVEDLGERTESGVLEAIEDIEALALSPGVDASTITKVEVKGGEGESLTCLKEGKGKVDGKGVLRVKPVVGAEKEAKFDLDFTTNGGIVSLKIELEAGGGGDETTAEGAAEFFTSQNEAASKCTTAGVKELEFKAAAVGSIG